MLTSVLRTLRSGSLPAVLLFVLLLPSTALASSTGLPGGLGLFVDPASGSKVAPLAPGESVWVHVMCDSVATNFLDGVQALQFGLEIDARLRVLEKTMDDGVLIGDEVGPDEWILGLEECVGPLDGPRELLRYRLTPFEGIVDLADLRVDLRPLDDYGEPMLSTRCLDSSRIERLANAGGVVLNPGSPAIVHLSGTPSVLVEGRPLRLAWETHGAQEVTLQRDPVVSTGGVEIFPIESGSYRLRAALDDRVVERSWSVELIRVPRIDVFRLEPFERDGDLMVRLEWDVRGASQVTLTDLGVRPARGSATLFPNDTTLWMLEASNEWGLSTALVTFEDPPDGPPQVLLFEADPNAFELGEPVRLDWRVYGADELRLEPLGWTLDPQAGTEEILLEGNTTLALVATNAHGSATKELYVGLRPPFIESFTADEELLSYGESTWLRWSVRGAATLHIEPGPGEVDPVAGAVEVTPLVSPAVYTLIAENPTSTVDRELTIQLRLPGAGLSAIPYPPYAGHPFTLKASLREAESATLEPGFGTIDPAGGEFITSIDEPTTFVLTATNPVGTVSNSLPLVPLRPKVELTAPPLPYPGPLTLHASIEGATSATLEPSVGAIDPAGGEIHVVVQDTTLFTLRASNPAGSAMDVLVVQPGRPDVTLVVADSLPWPHEPVLFTVSVAGADSAALEPVVGPIPPSDATYEAVVPEPAVVVLTAWNTVGAASDSVTVRPRAPVVALAADTIHPYPDHPFTLTAAIEGALEAVLLPDPGTIDPAGGAYALAVRDTTTFLLRATNAAGVSMDSVQIAPHPPSVWLEIQPDQPWFGQEIEITTRVEGAESAYLEPGFGPVSPEGITELSTTIEDSSHYWLTATNAVGESIVMVPVEPGAPTARLTPLDPHPFPGQTVRLVTETRFAESATLEPEVGEIPVGFGVQFVAVDDTTTFVLTARTPYQSDADSLTICVLPPQLALQPSEEQFYPGEELTLTVLVEGADAAWLEPGFGAIDPSGGVFSIVPLDTVTYTLRAENLAGDSELSTTLLPLAPGIEFFSADPPALVFPDSTTLGWSVRGMDSLVIEPGGLRSLAANGEWGVRVEAETIFTLTAHNRVGSSQHSLAVVESSFLIERFDADPAVVPLGSSTLLRWEVVGPAELELEGFGPMPLVGSQWVRPERSRAYTLRVWDEGREQQQNVFVRTEFREIPGALSLSFDENARQTDSWFVMPFVGFDIYLLAFEMTEGLRRFELSLESSPDLVVLERTMRGAAPLDLASGLDDWNVTVGGCLWDSPLALLVYHCLVLDDDALDRAWLDVGPSRRLELDPGLPVFWSCEEGTGPQTFFVAPRLALGSQGLPVSPAPVRLMAEATTGGVELRWELAEGLEPEGLVLWRAEGDGAPEILLHGVGEEIPEGRRWLDEAVRRGRAYRYRLVAEAFGREFGSEEIRVTVTGAGPTRTRLLANVPNPFNPSTEIRFELAAPGPAKVTVFDLSGRRVRELREPHLEAGPHALIWDGRDARGDEVASGVYLLRLTTDSGVDSRRVALLR